MPSLAELLRAQAAKKSVTVVAVAQTEETSLEELFAPTQGTPSAEPAKAVHAAEEVKFAASETRISSPAGAVAVEGMDGLDGIEAKDVARIRDAIDFLRNSFEEPKLVGDSTRTILVMLKAHPEFRKILLPEDIGLMVRGIHESTGQVVASKVLKKDKRETKAKKNNELDMQIADAMGDLDDMLQGGMFKK